MSAPVIQIDHLRNGFDGGRWIFVDAELAPDFYSGANAEEIISKFAERASRGAEEFNVRPVLPLYLPGEPVELEARWNSTHSQNAAVSIIIDAENHGGSGLGQHLCPNLPQILAFPSPKEKG